VLNPGHDAARIGARFGHPDFARRGLGTVILGACDRAAAAAGYRAVRPEHAALPVTKTGYLSHFATPATVAALGPSPFAGLARRGKPDRLAVPLALASALLQEFFEKVGRSSRPHAPDRRRENRRRMAPVSVSA
jgi:hypothetical protein